MAAGTLYVVATPIGNLGDLSPRAREVLARVQLIAAEDTRHTRQLLQAFGIATALTSLHEHNEIHKSAALISRLTSGESLALVSDAGTPLISDPGFDLVVAASVSNPNPNMIATSTPYMLVRTSWFQKRSTLYPCDSSQRVRRLSAAKPPGAPCCAPSTSTISLAE